MVNAILLIKILIISSIFSKNYRFFDYLAKEYDAYFNSKNDYEKEQNLNNLDKDQKKAYEDYIYRQSYVSGDSKQGYETDFRRFYSNTVDNAEILENEKEKHTTEENELYQFVTANGNTISVADYQKDIANKQNNLDGISQQANVLRSQYESGAIDYDTYRMKMAQLQASWDEIIDSLESLDVVGGNWIDFDTTEKELQKQLNSAKTLRELALENDNEVEAAKFDQQIQDLNDQLSDIKKKKDDQEYYKTVQEYNYILENGSDEDKFKYAELVSHRDDILIERLANIGLSGILSIANTPFNIADLVVEGWDRVDGKNDFDPNNPNLTSNKLALMKRELDNYSVTGTTGAYRYSLESINSFSIIR